ncbi:MAG: HD domain-containing protein [Myxococcota bacterium]
MSPYTPERYVEALRFAAAAHRDQRVPGTELPYLVHVVSVAAEVVAALPPRYDPAHDLAVQCALLHDTVEDTDRTVDDVAAAFGDDVARGVDALSKRPHLPKPDQMDDSLARILACPAPIGWVKLADRVTNLDAPPHYWDRDKRIAYRAEAGRILDRLGHTSEPLAARLRARIAAYEAFVR